MKVLQTVNLGKTLSANASNVRYSVFDTLGSIKVSATNSGVYELGFIPVDGRSTKKQIK